MNYLRQSTAVSVTIGPFIDDTDGKTLETALTIAQSDVRVSKNGGAYGQKDDSTAATHQEFGNYSVPLSTTDTGTLGGVRIFVTKTGALPVWEDYSVIPAAVYDSLVAGTTQLAVQTASIASSAVTSVQAGIARTTDLSNLVTTASLTGLAKTSDLSTVAKSTELSGLARSTELSGLSTLAKESTLTAVGSGVTGIKAITDQLSFTTEGMVNASASVDIDLSSLATEESVSSLDGKVTAIKDKTDSLSFTGTDVRATLDGEAVSVSTAEVSAIRAGIALSSEIAGVVETLEAIKGDGWADESLQSIYQALASSRGTGTREFVYRVWADSQETQGIDGAMVWVKDLTGTTVVAGPQLTNNEGAVTFRLDPGQYQFMTQCPGFSFPIDVEEVS